ncbi:retropepsin-like aspartic protease family protein [Sphingomonas sp. SRS2]|uniref:retropepsin-like aspartic protease family protein n=1 Tax=Sphingomonas sp. SRS2 TaxID=133190 RepID=UPI0006184EBB|nr:TIGR02281 family clan AA aspartic protease [Sphingomonas sp. SRS2]KKC27269.1 peptidase [Sphingomonas sp. SRS2]
MNPTIDPGWPMLAVYAGAAALMLILLFKLPYIGRLLRLAFSIAFLGFGLFLLARQAPFDPTLAALWDRLGFEQQTISGREVRIAMAPDGHFWARVEVNGVKRRMLVDSGATVTALSPQTAQAAGVEASAGPLPVLLRTANGTVQAQTGVIDHLQLGEIEAQALPVIVAPALGPVDILGMNFLSQLESWRVEGRTLILVPRMTGRDRSLGEGV